MNNKELQIKNESIFTKIINFFKGIFGSKKQSEEIVQDISTIKSESTNEIVKKTMETNFLEEIKVKKEDSYLLELQNLYECKSMDVCLMTDEEIESLNSLYNRQINELTQKLNEKRIELNKLKSRINSYSE